MTTNRRLRYILAILGAYLLVTVLLAGQSVASARRQELLVKHRTGHQAQVRSRIAAAGAKVTGEIPQIRVHRVTVPDTVDIDKLSTNLKKNPNVEYVGPNHIVSICLEPDDEWFYDPWLGWYWQWGLYDVVNPNAGIQATLAWDITTGGTNIIIAVIDTGVGATHEDLNAKIVPGRNVITGAADPDDTDDEHGHGTFSAGVCAAETNNFIGVAGVSWGAKIMPIKALDATGYGTEFDAAQGMIWAADHGAHIINMSFGGYDDMQVEQDAVEYAFAQGCVLVGASGNDDSSDLFYPASYDEVIAVGASNEYMQRCTAADWLIGGSNYGPYLDVLAPGNGIMSTWKVSGLGGDYEIASGTSAAAPFVSGIAALLLTEHPDWTNSQIADQIKLSARDVGTTGWDQYTGWGVVSAYHALIDPPMEAVSIGELSSIASGNFVKVADAVITSGSGQLSDRFYAEQQDRASGIALPYTNPPAGYSEGDVVEITGTLMTIDGERLIQGATLVKTDTVDPIRPVAFANKWSGGARIGYKSGVEGGKGLNNLCLLVTVCGRVTATSWTYFYIDDGSGMEDGSGHTGLRIESGDLNKPGVDSFVCITGISSCERPEGAGVTIPVIRPRIQSDILIL